MNAVIPFYCALAAAIMQDYGQQRVFNLKGGMLAWEAAGFPQAVE